MFTGAVGRGQIVAHGQQQRPLSPSRGVGFVGAPSSVRWPGQWPGLRRCFRITTLTRLGLVLVHVGIRTVRGASISLSPASCHACLSDKRAAARQVEPLRLAVRRPWGVGAA